MEHIDNLDRTESLKRLAPDLYNYQSVLYIGARNDRFDYGIDFKKANYNITVLEVWEPNCKFLKSIPWVSKVIQADLKDCNIDNKYAVVFWWHGPEHIELELLPPILDKLEGATEKLIVLGCPWGSYPIGALGGNPYEKHVSEVEPDIFEKYGYTCECLGKRGVGSNITAVKRMVK